MMDDEHASRLDDRMAALEQRVAILERGVASPGHQLAGDGSSTAPDRLWALAVLAERRGEPYESEGARGSLLYAGSLTAPGSGTVAWQIERAVPPILQDAWDPCASVLAALGHPVRLEIVRQLLEGARTSQDLQEIADLGTTGRLYHHLRELQSCGLVVATRRNHYAIPHEKVVPCLVMVAAALELAPSLSGEEAATLEVQDQ